jgi:hypothetical protein
MTPRSKADQLLIKFKMSECTHGYNDVRDIHAANRCAITKYRSIFNNGLVARSKKRTRKI